MAPMVDFTRSEIASFLTGKGKPTLPNAIQYPDFRDFRRCTSKEDRAQFGDDCPQPSGSAPMVVARFDIKNLADCGPRGVWGRFTGTQEIRLWRALSRCCQGETPCTLWITRWDGIVTPVAGAPQPNGEGVISNTTPLKMTGRMGGFVSGVRLVEDDPKFVGEPYDYALYSSAYNLPKAFDQLFEEPYRVFKTTPTLTPPIRAAYSYERKGQKPFLQSMTGTSGNVE